MIQLSSRAELTAIASPRLKSGNQCLRIRRLQSSRHPSRPGTTGEKTPLTGENFGNQSYESHVSQRHAVLDHSLRLRSQVPLRVSSYPVIQLTGFALSYLCHTLHLGPRRNGFGVPIATLRGYERNRRELDICEDESDRGPSGYNRAGRNVGTCQTGRTTARTTHQAWTSSC